MRIRGVTKMKTCSKCFAEIPEGNSFCNLCGAKVTTEPELSPLGVSTANNIDTEASRREKERGDRLTELKYKLLQLEAEEVEVSRAIKEREDFEASLDYWYNSNTSSYLWRVFSKMQENISLTTKVLAGYEASVSNLSIPDPGIMHALRKKFHRRLLATSAVIPGIMALFLWLPSLIASIVGHPSLVTFLSGLILSPLKIYSIGITSFIITVFLELASYYRGWSTYQARVNRSLWELEQVAANAASVRFEQLRLKSVYPQLREWLEILGHSLTHPWLIQKKWTESTSANVSEESLPYSMHIAQTDESDGPAMFAMQRYAAERFMIRGWRSRVLAEQVETIREQLGLSADRLTVELLDSDIAYAPNGPRSMVRGNISSKKVLERVAAKQIEPLTLQIQKEAISNTKPPVHEAKSEQTTSLNSGISGLESSEMAWDDFLAMPLGDATKMVSPFALHALSDAGRVNGHQSRADSFFILPQRLESRVSYAKSQNVRTYTENANLPMDIVVRLDFTGPIPNENLTLFAGSQSTLHEVASEELSSETSKPRKSGI